MTHLMVLTRYSAIIDARVSVRYAGSRHMR